MQGFEYFIAKHKQSVVGQLTIKSLYTANMFSKENWIFVPTCSWSKEGRIRIMWTYIYTHTHTYIYIYIYISLQSYVCYSILFRCTYLATLYLIHYIWWAFQYSWDLLRSRGDNRSFFNDKIIILKGMGENWPVQSDNNTLESEHVSIPSPRDVNSVS